MQEEIIPNKKGNKYEVGYCKPPKEYQIKPGEVRNPKGRPKNKTISEYLTEEDKQKLIEEYKNLALGIGSKQNYKVLLHLVDQIHGKAKQTVDNNIQVNKTIGELIDELDEFNYKPKTETIKQELENKQSIQNQRQKATDYYI